ncbi:hypothetical protein GLOTRDRAFT_134009 [Gloeophyllum trabeum ATCC 11539]|uniref:Uncharacterized protein n=1 Tax=Gloeophyllum trabeum (strain ATCC 11539 / FP-39264 / Madison 617) TaxID=670483 RepID=S7PR72_GLOTA|nr:uncharacterized protein GLOTRDRAFT_134009 [Gloeophyllum trabeum ATCC 11539]EPQ50341.1 hypothetical protein GLOTRDRAFT_134009 [Gloeophyllum trabeum ATCC 11539]
MPKRWKRKEAARRRSGYRDYADATALDRYAPAGGELDEDGAYRSMASLTVTCPCCGRRHNLIETMLFLALEDAMSSSQRHSSSSEYLESSAYIEEVEDNQLAVSPRRRATRGGRTKAKAGRFNIPPPLLWYVGVKAISYLLSFSLTVDKTIRSIAALYLFWRG